MFLFIQCQCFDKRGGVYLVEKVSVFIKIRVLFWPEIRALGVFFNFDNERMRPPEYPSAPRDMSWYLPWSMTAAYEMHISIIDFTKYRILKGGKLCFFFIKNKLTQVEVTDGKATANKLEKSL